MMHTHDPAQSCLRDSCIFITGGTGSFGRTCARMLLEKYNPKRLIIFSRDEQKHVEMQRNFFSSDQYPQLRYFIGDVRDRNRLEMAMKGADYVIHAAAMKHVDIAEYNPQECINTNVGGAENVIHAAIAAGVKKVVALSTDKACSPINLYGASKLCSDKLFVAANNLSGKDGPRFAVVRYGNVVGSKGSVIPFFLKEKKKGILPITDPRMTRFWITLEQGVNFVIGSFDRMIGGELFIPKIPSMNIKELAQAIAPECETRVVGIRPGEKLHECMITEEDARYTLDFGDHYLVQPGLHWWDAQYQVDSGSEPVPEGFRYSSEINEQWLKMDDLKKMIQDLGEQPV